MNPVIGSFLDVDPDESRFHLEQNLGKVREARRLLGQVTGSTVREVTGIRLQLTAITQDLENEIEALS